MNFQDHGHTLPHNVVAFPRTCRARPQHPFFVHEVQPAASKQAVAASGAGLNARLMVLLGICVTSAAIVISAVRFLQG
jgi:hypothetical protein